MANNAADLMNFYTLLLINQKIVITHKPHLPNQHFYVVNLHELFLVFYQINFDRRRNNAFTLTFL